MAVANMPIPELFRAQHAVYWGNLSRFNNLLVVLNVSLFFLTGLVERGYFYTLISLTFLCVVGVGMILPTPWLSNIRYYLLLLVLELAGLYFLVSSIVFWVRHTDMQMPFT